MLEISLSELSEIDFAITEVFGNFYTWAIGDSNDYTNQGRIRNLLFYQIEGTRDYFENGNHVLSLKPGDMIFIPNGWHYLTTITGSHKNYGVGISFHLIDETKEPIQIQDGIKLIGTNHSTSALRNFEETIRALRQSQTGKLRVKKGLYTLLDTAISCTSKDETVYKNFDDLQPAIQLIEQKPAKAISSSELAELCCMSERTFERRFKEYSGGIPPMKYRNIVRLMIAEELLSNHTLEETAELLGYCDSAHLCRSYAKQYGITPKQHRVLDD